MRIAIMAHGDYCDYNNYVERHVDFTSDVDALVEFAEHVPKTGGGDSPEVMITCTRINFEKIQGFKIYSAFSPKQTGQKHAIIIICRISNTQVYIKFTFYKVFGCNVTNSSFKSVPSIHFCKTRGSP